MELGGRYNHDEKYGSNFTYTLNPSIIIANQFKVFVTLASAYKSPSLYQLFSIYQNPAGLKPETTTSYEAGFDWQLIKNALSFNTVFYKYNSKDIIYFKGLSDNPYGIYENGQLQKDKGFESELKFNLDKFKASAYVAYVTGQLTDENGITTNNLFRRPKQTFGGSIYYEFFKSFSAGLNYKYTGERTDEQFNPDFSTSIVTLKSYSLVDLHLQATLGKHIILFGDLKNLFDEKYTDWLGYNTAGFNFMAGVKYQIN